ncbi:hypothetical protein LX92_04428 [Maribacter polysiphoniae]|uniref:Uncharacterized protein n=1 Tax=Maribacter polysiphoniae TaxID=429344 RepID=A0A316DH78_9FLAO|nr:hypothetical protein LX92_04428 [Maribacter polysiphoniae]
MLSDDERRGLYQDKQSFVSSSFCFLTDLIIVGIFLKWRVLTKDVVFIRMLTNKVSSAVAFVF